MPTLPECAAARTWTPNPEIEWQTPAQRPDVNSIRRSVERLLGHALTDLHYKYVRAQGEVWRKETGNCELRSVPSVGGGEGEDTLAAKKCRALADAMELKIALAADPLAEVESVELAPPGAFLAPTVPAPVARIEGATPRPIARSRARSIGLRAAGGFRGPRGRSWSPATRKRQPPRIHPRNQ